MKLIKSQGLKKIESTYLQEDRNMYMKENEMGYILSYLHMKRCNIDVFCTQAPGQ